MSSSSSLRWAGGILAGGILAALALISPAAAQVDDREAFTTADGLPSDQVFSLAQTADGRLWAGTDLGLSYYYGGKFFTEPGAAETMRDFPVRALHADDSGNLWAGTTAGLFLRTPQGDWLPGPDRFTTGGVLAIRPDSQGRIWAGGRSGLMVLEDGGWEPVSIEGADPVVTGLALDPVDRVWAAVETSAGTEVVVLENGVPAARFGAADGLDTSAAAAALASGPGETVWLGTNGGLFGFDGGSLELVYTQTVGLKSDVIGALLPDGTGGLLVGTTFGLDYVDPATGELRPPPWPVVVTGPAVQALLFDGEGGLWLGTNSGLLRVNTYRWQEITDPAVSGLQFVSLLETGDGVMYALSTRSLARKAPGDPAWEQISGDVGTGRFFTLGPYLPGFALAPESIVHIGAEGGLFVLTGEGLIRDDRLPDGLSVAAIHADPDEVAWVGTDRGLYRSAGGAFERIPELGEDGITAIWRSADGEQLWAAAANRGVYGLMNDAWEHFDRLSTGGGLPNDFVLAGISASDGSAWFGTLAGAARLMPGADPAEIPGWRPLSGTAVAGAQVSALAAAADGRVWLGTLAGLFYSDGEAATMFRVGPGPGSLPVTGLLLDGSGSLWVGTTRGLFVHRDAGVPPQVRVEAVLVDNRDCPAECREGGLPYRSGTATVRFAASDLGDPEGIAYRLAITATAPGDETAAVTPLLAEPVFTFDLAPGTAYEIAVQAVDRDFNFSEYTDPVRFAVAAPTWWDSLRDHPLFPLFAGVGTLLLAVGLVVGRRAWINRDPVGYTDLRIAFGEDGAGGYRVDYRTGPGSDPDPAETVLNLDWLRASQERIEGEAVGESALKDLGGALYSAMFPGRSLAELAGAAAYRRLRPVRIRLDFSAAPGLASLPWELAHDPALGFLGRQVDTPLLRAAGGGERVERRPLTGRLRVLAVLAQPEHPGLPPLNLAAERDLLERVAAGNGRLEVRFIAGPRSAASIGIPPAEVSVLDALRGELETGDPWDVVHFACHTGRERLPWGDLGALSLGLEDEAGRYDPAGPDRLEPFLDALRGAGRTPRLVVLNACRTAAAAGGLSAVFLESGIGAVLGMQWPVQDAAAAAFAEAFYRSLVRHGQMDHAVSAGRNAIAAALGEGRRDWAAPVLFSGQQDGFLFERE
ncbi:MAG TPA: two-component regulator propeller domain-containing protein [Anaerolineales bacterium]|nr:two-component regulator propeller domain-containing protein [Anaerolineales bacterium]